MKQSVSILEKSVKELLIYIVLILSFMLLVGFGISKFNYNEDVKKLQEDFNNQVDISLNKYIKEEVTNINKYLQVEYAYLNGSAKEIIDNLYLLLDAYLDSQSNQENALQFLFSSVGYPIELNIVSEVEKNYLHHARYIKLENNKLLKISISDEKYLSASFDVALKNIKNLHNYALSDFSVEKLPMDFNYNNTEHFYCDTQKDSMQCYNRNFWISFSYKINTKELEKSLELAKDTKYKNFLVQATFIFLSIGISFIFLLIFALTKKNMVKQEISHASEYFLSILDDKQVKCDFKYQEFRELSIGILKFLKKVKQKDNDIKKMAFIDPITRLMNMLSLNMSLKNYTVKDDNKLVFCFFNIEGFKTLNSMYGREFGDEVLKVVAYRLYCLGMDIAIGDEEHFEAQYYIKNNKFEFSHLDDRFFAIARIGADEFILVEEINKHTQADELAQKYHKCLSARSIIIKSNSNNVEYQPFKISAKVGYSVYPDDSENIINCVHLADLAINNKLAKYKNCVFGYTKAIGELTTQNLHLQQDIRKGIENKEFVLYYQPKIDCKSGKVVGAEALVRWKRGDKIVMPDEFIGICERSNLIIMLGNDIIRMACETQKKWIKMGLNLKLSINLSSKQLLSDTIISTIEENLKGIDPNLIEFEITENFAIENLTDKEVVKQIKGLRVGLSMDDFGKGYSSLSYLNDNDLDFDIVKIDKSFIRNIHKDKKSQQLVRFILELVKSLNKKSIAEGVENLESLQFLQEQGCDEYQGYYFSKPVPEEEFLKKVM
ncbi:putative bifunctional diguanylate cyclase/phosphodiesterase [Campylobacter canadensis]|uniref:Bifunctional diguanylate cyclase/phosphodiesterase n=1 Tax=Campylobacter canadensis TaxID=449520 RepID=A0ABS7WQS1_9BACT|nr:bifunctional diguanylate cyclase/phosphodiesterase [Campylobacter canadensis]MBZ7986647.1 bifunctional diguanylate cyclase/phosphodiesterase [Campylobacter canadensis]MBZ7996264.1 bifunctional diguanylate cyclase/phosphodiesterase [Campylobacter canadensis]MBZ7997683.1 bifunctional diguanylate cyclase/phosphodiesterase [Campylobacter canadensis]MBZ7999281.1 bifunctional diguanylate cyclase/phosphodiesterase [Campylobacter canadensis]MBZ8001077.1 bifunctional diguanylate cyclase/phosphodiest